MNRLIAIVLLFVLAALPACTGSFSTSPLVRGTGTIRPAAAECSSWFIRADRGGMFELTQLDVRFQKDGLRVRFTLRKRSDMVSACMVGEIADVVSIVPR